MKRSIVLFWFVLLAACTPPPPPDLALNLSPSPLMYGAEAVIHLHVSNSGKTDWQSYQLLLGYAPENDTGMYKISEIPLTLAAGQVFEQDIPWHVDLQPASGVKYQVRLALLSPQSVTLAETSIPVEFVEPALTVSVSPTLLAKNTHATIRVRVSNPSGADWKDYTLSIGYGKENDASSFLIQEMPLSLGAGKTLDQEILWTVDFIPDGGNYEVIATVLLPGNVLLTSTKTPVILSTP